MPNIVAFLIICCAVLSAVLARTLWDGSRRHGSGDPSLAELLGDLNALNMYLNQDKLNIYTNLNLRRHAKSWPLMRQAPSKNNQIPKVTSVSKTQAAKLEIEELENALRESPTPLINTPWVQKEGLNDFLVMRPYEYDYSKTIPNDIYYEIEKKCVNWLDNCTIKGLANRLFTKLRYPWRR